MMKPKYLTHLMILAALFLTGCRGCRKPISSIDDSVISLETAIEFRSNFLHCPNENYHIPQALMYEIIEFDSLFAMSGINKLRLYPAINTHHDDAADTLTFIMVPVNEGDNTDNVSGYLFDYAQPCPSNCSPSPAPSMAPTEKVLDLNIPQSWCITKKTIDGIIAEAESKVGPGNVYGIRFYWFTNVNGIMDLEIKPTELASDGQIRNIAELSFTDITEICNEASGCCDTNSPLFNTNHK
jgi:hypothetical protein